MARLSLFTVALGVGVIFGPAALVALSGVPVGLALAAHGIKGT